MRDRVGAKDPRSWQLRTHAQTSGVSLSAQQPLLNLARTAIEALGAMMAGTQSLHTNAWDETLSIPTEESATLALRTQQMIAGETGVASWPTRWAGRCSSRSSPTSWRPRRATTSRASTTSAGWSRPSRRASRRPRSPRPSYTTSASSSSGERLMVGVNAHVEADEEEPDIHRADPEVERRQIEHLRAWRAARDAGGHAARAGRRGHRVRGHENVMPGLVAAADAGATIGELCDVFASVWGAYRDPARW